MEPEKMIDIGPLVKIISHDLRGPLGNLKNVVALFKSGELEMEQAKMFMHHIELGVDRSLELLDQLIEWSHASSESKKVTKEELDVNELINEVRKELNGTFEEKNISFNFDEKKLPKGFFDRSALKLMVKNLLSNGVKFTGLGGEVSLDVEDNKGELVVNVSDNGIGIPEKMLETIFEMGKDNRRLGTNEEKGTGIGLFICRDLAQRNESEIWIDSTEEEAGTTVKFTIKKA